MWTNSFNNPSLSFILSFHRRRLWRSEEKFRAIRTNLHISAQLDLLKKAGLEPEDVSEEDKQRLKIEDESKW